MLIAVAVCLLLLIALLAIPITLRFELSWPRASRQSLELQWGFGLVRLQIPVSGPSEQQAHHAARSLQKKKQKKRRNVFAVLRQRAFRRRILRFIRELWHALRKQDVRIRVRLGLGDPADTGQLWAIVGPVAGMLSNFKEASIKIEPTFVDTTFELDSSGTLRVIPLQVLYFTVALFLSAPIWRGIRQLR
jgi:Protein of unknown function (DUF2953)